MKPFDFLFILICGIAVFNSLFLVVYLWLQKNRNIYSTFLLSAFLLATAYRITKLILFYFTVKSGFVLYASWLSTISLIGPFLFLYLKAVSEKTFIFKLKDLSHFIFFLAIILFNLIFGQAVSNDPVYYYTVPLVVLCQFLIYILYSFRYIHEFKRTFPISTAYPKESVNPRWLQNIALCISVLWLIDVINCLQSILRSNHPAGIIFEAVFYSVIIYLIIFIELKYRKITAVNNYTMKYQSSGLGSEGSRELKEKILQYFNTEKPYLEPDLTLTKLAKKLGLTNHILSQVINEQFQLNYNDFVNTYRVEAARQMIIDPGTKDFTIASIAYECGFNTLSAFNSAFKKHTGMTPSFYREKAVGSRQ